jgi:dihydrolipoamide dehydrogenase
MQLKLDKKAFIEVSDRYETGAKGIFAAGDVIGPPWLKNTRFEG